jgi:hypothetical protein
VLGKNGADIKAKDKGNNRKANSCYQAYNPEQGF